MLLVVLLILLIGCGRDGRKREPETEVHKGTDGVVMNFVPRSIPDRIYPDTDFTPIIELRNRGATEIVRGYGWLSFSGIDPKIIPAYFDKNHPEGYFELDPVTSYNPEGGYDSVAINAYVDPEALYETDYYRPLLLVTACYEYETIANPIVCIDPNPRSLTERKACLVEDVSLGGGQGAPIAISRVDVEETPQNVYFRIYIDNVGGGEVFDKKELGLCPYQLDYPSMDLVYVGEDENDISGVTVRSLSLAEPCKPNPVRLVNGHGTVFCKFWNDARVPAYETPLRIRLTYAYKDSISEQLEVRNLQ